MPFSQLILLHMPLIFLFLITSLIAIGISNTAIIVMRRYVPHHRLKLHNDVAGPIFGTVGVIYAVLLAFTTVIAWQDFDRAGLNVEREVNYLADLYTDAEVFQEPFRQKARNLLIEYAKTVTEKEWKALSRGQEEPQARELIRKMWALYGSYSPKTTAEQVFFEESVHKLNDMRESRGLRIMESRNGIGAMLWFVLIVGAMITVIFTVFFGSENLWAQVIMSNLLAVLIAFILFTVLAFDYPFTGRVSVSPQPFRDFLAQIPRP